MRYAETAIANVFLYSRPDDVESSRDRFDGKNMALCRPVIGYVCYGVVRSPSAIFDKDNISIMIVVEFETAFGSF